jgi:predicted signal transduction protein with EAL and GGDEF domain
MEPVATAACLLRPGGDRTLAGAIVGNKDNQISHEAQSRSAAICTAVQTALRQNRLLFAFQPVVCAATGETDYFECLLRMRDVGGGIIDGGEFITPIEQLGLIGFIDDYVLQLTVRELARHPGLGSGSTYPG